MKGKISQSMFAGGMADILNKFDFLSSVHLSIFYAGKIFEALQVFFLHKISAWRMSNWIFDFIKYSERRIISTKKNNYLFIIIYKFVHFVRQFFLRYPTSYFQWRTINCKVTSIKGHVTFYELHRWVIEGHWRKSMEFDWEQIYWKSKISYDKYSNIFFQLNQL